MMGFSHVSRFHLRWLLRLCRLAVTSGCVLLAACAGTQVAVGATAGPPIIDRLAAIETEYSTHEPRAPIPPSLAASVDAILGRIEADGALPAGAPSVRALNKLIFEDLAVRASSDLHDPGNLFVSSVLARRQGYCVGVAALYLVLAERLGLPIFAVDTPNHVFLRYDDGVTRINIESMDGGEAREDADYIREQKIPEVSIRRGVFMRNLTADEFLARFHSNLGVIFSEKKGYARAAREYRTAIDLDPSLPAAYYNLGNDLLRQEEWRASIRYFSESLRLYPTDVWALNNRGFCQVKLGKLDKGRRDFETALRIDPGFGEARRNLDAIR